MLHVLSRLTNRCEVCGLDPADRRYTVDCPGVEQEQKTRGIAAEPPTKVLSIARDNTKVVESSDLQQSLKILDDIKARLVSGEIVCATGVLIAPDDATYSFIARTRHVSRLRTTGALAWVLHMFMRDTEKQEGAPR